MDVNDKRKLIINYCRSAGTTDAGCKYLELEPDSVIEKLFQKLYYSGAERKITINSLTDSQMAYSKIWEAFDKKMNNSQEYNKNLYGGQATLQPPNQSTGVVIYYSSEAQNEKLKDETETNLESEHKYGWQWKEVEYGYECPACHCFFDYESTYGIFDHNFAYASYCPNCGVKMEVEKEE